MVADILEWDTVVSLYMEFTWSFLTLIALFVHLTGVFCSDLSSVTLLDWAVITGDPRELLLASLISAMAWMDFRALEKQPKEGQLKSLLEKPTISKRDGEIEMLWTELLKPSWARSAFCINLWVSIGAKRAIETIPWKISCVASDSVVQWLLLCHLG